MLPNSVSDTVPTRVSSLPTAVISSKTTKYVLKYTIYADQFDFSSVMAILTVFQGRRAVMTVKQVLEFGWFLA